MNAQRVSSTNRKLDLKSNTSLENLRSILRCRGKGKKSVLKSKGTSKLWFKMTQKTQIQINTRRRSSVNDWSKLIKIALNQEIKLILTEQKIAWLLSLTLREKGEES